MNTSKLAHQARLRSWAESFRDQKESGLTVMEWCSQNGVSKDAYFYWKRRLRDEYVESRLPEIVKIPLASETRDCASPKSSCTSRTSDTTDTTRAPVAAVSMPAQTCNNAGSLLMHIQDISLEINEDTPAALITNIIKAVRDA